MLRLVLTISTLVVLLPDAYGQEVQENFVPVRALGMGNAFTAVANDESAVWTNPAGIARARKHRTREFLIAKFPNAGLGANQKTRNLYDAIKADGESEVSDIVAQSEDLGTDTPYYANAHIYPSIVFDYDRQSPGAIGIFSNTNSNLFIDEETPQQARSNIVSDTGGVLNFNWTNRTNRFTVGAQARYIIRYAYEDTIPTNDLNNKTALQERVQENANQTTGIGLDVGMLYTFADFWFPTFGVSILNLPTGCKENYLNPFTEQRETVCGNLYSGTITNEDALSTVDPTDIRVGISIAPRLTRRLTMRIALDAHHVWITNGDQTIGLSGIDAQKMLHAGVEIYPGNPLERGPFAVRAGLNQGYVTGGVSLHLPYFAIDVATYGVDVAGGAKKVEDRRYIASVGVSI